MPIKLVLFDIDGTILLTSGAGRRAMVAAVSEEIGTNSVAPIRFDGKTDPQIVAELLEGAGVAQPVSSEQIDRICRRYVQLLADELSRPTARTTVMPGIHTLLDRLDNEEGVLLGLLTGNVACQSVLRKTGITSLRGKWTQMDRSWVMPIFHPSYLLRNPTREPGSPKALMWEDIREVRRKYDELTATHP